VESPKVIKAEIRRKRKKFHHRDTEGTEKTKRKKEEEKKFSAESAEDAEKIGHIVRNHHCRIHHHKGGGLVIPVKTGIHLKKL
jgi:hypothetical protein